MGTTEQKLTYLNTTKGKIKDSINLTGAGITTEPFRQYAVKLKDAYVDIINNGTDTLYNNFPKQTGTGETLSLTPTYQAPMKIDLKGNIYQKNAIIPSEYTQVNYIIPTGNAYITTGIKAKGSLKIITDIEVVDTPSGNMTLFGARDNANVNANVLLYAHSTPRFRNDYNTTNNYASPNISNLLTKWHIVKDKGSLTATSSDNQTITETTTNTTFTSSYDMDIFNANSGGSRMNQSKYRLYNFTIYDDTTLVRDFIPCYRNSDNEVGLYDIVNGVFYGKSGSGSLSYGSVVSIPNPSYPQDINVVSGNNTITICGKNLLPTNKNDWEQGSISGIDGTDASSTTRLRTIDYYLFKNDTDYYLSLDGGSPYNFLNLIFYDKNKTFVGAYYSYDSSITGSVNKKINLPSNIMPNVAYVRATIRKGSNETITTDDIPTIKPMMELGEQKTTYEAYKSQTYPITLPAGMELCKIGTYQDSFVYTNDKWYKRENINKVVLNGSESWGTASTSDNNRFVCNTYTDALIPQSTTIVGSLLCNKLIPVSADATSSANNGITIAASGKLVFYYSEVKTYTSAQIKTWLGTNNLIVYYALATATDTEITDTTLINQLEAIRLNALSYNGTTNILQTNNDLPFIIDGSALKKEQ